MNRYIIYDFETTGLDVLKDRAVEVGALLIENKKVKDSFVTIINCGKESGPEALNVHGIDFKTSQKGMEPKKAFQKLSEFIDGNFLVAHNGNNFDNFMLKAELHRYGITIPDCKLIDSMMLAQKAKLGISRFSLHELCSHFKVKNTEAHRSLGDTKALLKVFEKLRSDHDLDAIHKISREKKLSDIFPGLASFELLLKSLDEKRALEVIYENQKGEVKQRWILPQETDLPFGSMCPMIKAICLTSNEEKNFRLDGFRKFLAIK
jgi:DNA polymerase III subunit epsilon